MIPDHAESMYSRFEQAGIPLPLAGGWAVGHHGCSRLTTDVDWVCSRENEDQAVKLMCERFAGPDAYDKLRAKS